MSGPSQSAGLSVGFIGGGRITRLLLEALAKTGRVPEHVVVSDTSAEVLQKLTQKFAQVETAAGDNKKPSSCDLVFLALHPPAIAPVLADISGTLKPAATFVSLAPRVSIRRMSEALGGFSRIVRMIPNAPSILGEGYNPVCFSDALGEGERKSLLDLFKVWGECPEVKEESLEAYAILSAMGPTYFWFQLQALRSLGGSFGLTPADTDKALSAMIAGTRKTIFDSGLSYDEVVDLIPVKPLGEDEPAIRQIYETRLTGLYGKLKG